MSGFKRFIQLVEVDHPEGLTQTELFLSVRPKTKSGFANNRFTAPAPARRMQTFDLYPPRTGHGVRGTSLPCRFLRSPDEARHAVLTIHQLDRRQLQPQYLDDRVLDGRTRALLVAGLDLRLAWLWDHLSLHRTQREAWRSSPYHLPRCRENILRNLGQSLVHAQQRCHGLCVVRCPGA